MDSWLHGVRGVRATDAAGGRRDRSLGSAEASPGRGVWPVRTGLVIGDRCRPDAVARRRPAVRAWRRSSRSGSTRIADPSHSRPWQARACATACRPDPPACSAGRWRDPQPLAGLEAVGRPRVQGLDRRRATPRSSWRCCTGCRPSGSRRCSSAGVPGHGLSSAYRLEVGLAVGFGVGAGVGGRWPDWAWGSAVRSDSAWASGSAGVGLGVGAAVAAAVAVRRRRGRGRRGRRRRSRPRRGRAPVGPARSAAVRASPPLATHERDRQEEGPDADGQGDRRSPGSRAGRPGPRSSGLAGSSTTAQVARAVDVAAGQADELLLAERLGHRSAERRASVGRIRRLDRATPRRSPSSIDAQEWADPGFADACPRRRARRTASGVAGRRVAPDRPSGSAARGCVGRRRVVLHARSVVPPWVERRGV